MNRMIETMRRFPPFSKLHVILLIILLHLNSDGVNSMINHQATRIGSIKIDFDSSTAFGKSWPEGIKFVKSTSSFPKFQSFFNTSDYPYLSTSSNTNTPPFSTSSSPLKKKTFSWHGSDILTISMDLSDNSHTDSLHSLNGIPSLHVPPLSWIKSAASNDACKIKVVQQRKETLANGARDVEKRVVEISVPKTLAESTIATLKGFGFEKKDIFRMMEKAPYILAINTNKILSKLIPELCAALDVPMPLLESSPQSSCSVAETSKSYSRVLHLIAHCPYLIIQHHNTPGKDFSLLYRLLLELGYSQTNLWKDLSLFPSILTSSAERILGWKKVFDWFYDNAGVESDGSRRKRGAPPRSFSSLLRKAPFLFYLDPPHSPSEFLSFFSLEGIGDSGNQQVLSHRIVTNLDYLSTLRLPDLDKIIRSEPTLLLQHSDEIASRIAVLVDIVQQGKDEIHGVSMSSTRLTAVKNENVARFDRSSLLVVTDSHLEERVQSEFRLAPLWLTYYHQFQKQEIRNLSPLPSFYKTASVISSEHLQSISDTRMILNSLVQSNPAVLSFPHKRIIETIFFLEKYGFNAHQILKIIKRAPLIFRLSLRNVQGNLFFLQQAFGVRQRELIPLIVRHPMLLMEEVPSLQMKVDYFLRFYPKLASTIASTSSGQIVHRVALLSAPQYLLLSFDDVIQPRCEFLLRMLQKKKSSHSLFLKPTDVINLLISSSEDFCQRVGIPQSSYSEVHRLKHA